MEKLLIDVKRHSEQVFSFLFTHFQEYCENNKIHLQGKLPKFFVDHLLAVELNEKKQTAKIGNSFLKTLDWEKILVAIDRERLRIWSRDFDPISFRDHLLNVYLEIIWSNPKKRFIIKEDSNIIAYAKPSNLFWKTLYLIHKYSGE